MFVSVEAMDNFIIQANIELTELNLMSEQNGRLSDEMSVEIVDVLHPAQFFVQRSISFNVKYIQYVANWLYD